MNRLISQTCVWFSGEATLLQQTPLYEEVDRIFSFPPALCLRVPVHACSSGRAACSSIELNGTNLLHFKGAEAGLQFKTVSEACYAFVQFFTTLLDDSLPLLVLTITSFQIDAAISQVPLSANNQQTLLGTLLVTTSGKAFPSQQE